MAAIREQETPVTHARQASQNPAKPPLTRPRSFRDDSHKVFHGFIDRHGHLTTNLNDPHAGTGVFQGTFTQYMNNRGVLAGYYIDAQGVQHGFIDRGGKFTTINAPHAGTKSGQGTLVFGINDHCVLVGQYFNSHNQGIAFTGAFTTVKDPHAVPFSTVAATISNSGLIAGFYTDPHGVSHGFYDRGGKFRTIDDPHASAKEGGTLSFASSNNGLGAGYYNDAHGHTHGFTFTPAR